MSEALIQEILESIQLHSSALDSPNVAHLVIHSNKVVSSHALPGLEIQVRELAEGIDADITVTEGTVIEQPVHMCFGMLPQEGVQRIVLRVDVQPKARISIIAHCTFPNAVNVRHLMDAEIRIGQEAHYTYFERHVHGKEGGVIVVPKAVVDVGKRARFHTEFELLRGRVGQIDIDYETTCRDFGVMEMTARINGTGEDVIKIREVGHLIGEGARGALTSKIAVRGNARAEVYNKLTASAAYARGHVDCKEIVQDNGVAMAIPIVEVNHPKAHVTHEAAIGSVDTRKLETLMARGLNEDEASEMIIQGMLS